MPLSPWQRRQYAPLKRRLSSTRLQAVIHPSIHPSNGSTAQIGPWPPPFWGFLFIHNWTHGRTPLDEWTARRRGLYLHRTTQHINVRASMLSAGFEHAIPATKRPQTCALDREATRLSLQAVTFIYCTSLPPSSELQRYRALIHNRKHVNTSQA
jgi:hypothetical protein